MARQPSCEKWSSNAEVSGRDKEVSMAAKDRCKWFKDVADKEAGQMRSARGERGDRCQLWHKRRARYTFLECETHSLTSISMIPFWPRSQHNVSKCGNSGVAVAV